MLRQQLQQHLRNQSHAMRGFGDFLRRSLTVVAELALSTPPPPSLPSLRLRTLACRHPA